MVWSDSVFGDLIRNGLLYNLCDGTLYFAPRITLSRKVQCCTMNTQERKYRFGISFSWSFTWSRIRKFHLLCRVIHTETTHSRWKNVTVINFSISGGMARWSVCRDQGPLLPRTNNTIVSLDWTITSRYLYDTRIETICLLLLDSPHQIIKCLTDCVEWRKSHHGWA